MRIRQLAALSGVSTRTVRHYHQVGVLPEPGRSSNGYRDYDISHAVRLVRVRRLIAVGLTLDDIAVVLGDERGFDLDELLAEVAAELESRRQALGQRLERIAELRRRLQTSPGGLRDALDEQGLIDYFDAVRDAGTDGPAVDQDRRLLSLLDGEDAVELGAVLGSVADDPDAAARLADLYQRFDALRETPRPEPGVVAELVDDIIAALPPAMITRAREQLQTGEAVDLGLVTEDLTPGQRTVVDALVAALARS